MPSLVHQIGELFLRAVPVALIVIAFYFVLRSLFFKPILAVMAEREARTSGAQKSAEAAQAAAAEKIRQYEEALRQAKAKVYAEQEAERKKLLDERAGVLKEARNKAASEVGKSKQRVEAELETAKKDVESIASQLAAEIASRVLQISPEPLRPPGKRHETISDANLEVVNSRSHVVLRSSRSSRGRGRKSRGTVFWIYFQVDPFPDYRDCHLLAYQKGFAAVHSPPCRSNQRCDHQGHRGKSGGRKAVEGSSRETDYVGTGNSTIS